MEYIDLVIIHKYDVNCPIEGRNSLGNLRFHEKKKFLRVVVIPVKLKSPLRVSRSRRSLEKILN